MGRRRTVRASAATLAARLRDLAGEVESSRLPPETFLEIEALAGHIGEVLMEIALAAPPVETQEASGAAILIWCDGSCAPNPGPGGWGAIVEQERHRIELSGAHPDCTNNMMEMTAAIRALERTPEGAEIHITTDSRYVMDGITKWIAGWKRKGWRKSDKKPVLNQGLWMELDALNAKRKVTWNWVRGHSGHPENERCDELANQARLER